MTGDLVKRNLGRAAVDELVRSGMRVGLGTGSTAVEAVRRVAELLAQDRLQSMLFVPTSLETEEECERLAVPLTTLNDPRVAGVLDLSIDGADEVDPGWALVKGGGAALLTEKIVAAASRRYAIVVTAVKLVPRLGQNARIPVEVVREARTTAARALETLGGEPMVRVGAGKAGPVITDHGNLILDVRFQGAFEPRDMERRIAAIPGVAGSGIFTVPVTDLFVAAADGCVRHEKAGQRRAGPEDAKD
jgi:ribose 5-phosphate isomerase A